MKEADIFESWINRLAEGTWATPKKPEQLNKLKELMSKELIVGPDGTNATEQLYSLVGDDILFDRIDELAYDTNGKANVWDDSVVQARLQELGIDTSTIGQPVDAEPTGTEPGIQPEQPVAPTQDMPQEPPMAPVSEADDTSTFESLNAMRKAAGLPVVESRNESTSQYVDELIGKILALEKPGMVIDKNNDDFYKAVYDELIEIGLTRQSASANVNNKDFISDVASAYHHYSKQSGIDEGAAVDAYMAGKSPALAHFADQLDKSEEKPLAECNMTMEGEYCPEHGLMECGGMYEMGTVAGSMAPVMGEGAGSKWYVTHELRTGDADRVAGPFADQQQAQAWMNDNLPMHLDDEGQYGTSEVVEGHDDPMNSNSAITGAYYESKSDDALLARIKSLALIK